ncbi:MAG TPA: hypothetical protein VGU44_04610, partial [Gammaproteobacteria bacterium]|nr:hypothetical protein [Gammaproteobacteria bacterium]
MINLEHFQKILERKHTNAIELKDVPFFEIEKNGHVAYLLGTDHSYDLSTLPEIVLTHIREVDQLFTEQAIPSVKEFCDFLETLRIKQTEQVIWDKVLNPEELKLFRKMVEEAFATIASGLQEFPFDPLALDPSFLMHIVGQHVDFLIEKIQVRVEDDESEIAEHPHPMMDEELITLFYDQTIRLEPDRSSVRTEEFDDGAIEKLKEKLLPFYSCSSKNLEELSTADRQAF